MDGMLFKVWLAEMKLMGIAQSDAAAARLLGVTPNTVVTAKREGVDRKTALACKALVLGLEPYDGMKAP